MKKLCLALLAVLFSYSWAAAKDYRVASPDGKLNVTVSVDKQVVYSLSYAGKALVQPSEIGMQVLGGRNWGQGSKVKKAVTTSHNGTIKAFAYKRNTIQDNYKQLALQFGDGFTLLFRAYNDGMAYRFVANQKKDFKVAGETMNLRFDQDWQTHTPYVRRGGTLEEQTYNSFENVYTDCRLSELNAQQLAFSPLLIETDTNIRLAIAEADVENYPGLFLHKGSAQNSLTGYLAAYPKEVKQGGHNMLQMEVQSREPYLTTATARQQFPWRIISVATADEQLLDDDMVYRLASPSRVADYSWVRPGKVAWDWWNDWALYGVDFKAGINTQTYKYYIDFAAKHGVEYVILDEGWAVNLKADLFQVVPEIDLKEIIDYGKQRGVGIILWAGYWAFDRDLERVCKHYSEMGVKGFKVDFMDRDDAQMVNFHYRAAKVAAKYKLMLDYHGTYKPTGLNRTYPNVINFEGVDGQENVKWSTMERYDQVNYNMVVPFARMLAGPMDYTQGAMLNGTKETFRPNNSFPMSHGTRTQQLAEYVVFLSPLNMLCDSPSNYEREPECTKFIAGMPTVWDESIALKSKIGQYVAVARQHGGKWYVGVINNWDARQLDLDLTALNVAGRKATAYLDGPNAAKAAQDYKKTEVTIGTNGHYTVSLAPGGGAVLVVE